MKLQSITLLTIGILILIVSTFTSCASESPTIVYSEYRIQSIRIDDESEFHIVAVSKKGRVTTIHDKRQGYYLKLAYKDISHPILYVLLNKTKSGSLSHTFRYEVYLPINYTIETFED